MWPQAGLYGIMDDRRPQCMCMHIYIYGHMAHIDRCRSTRGHGMIEIEDSRTKDHRTAHVAKAYVWVHAHVDGPRCPYCVHVESLARV